MKRDLLTTLQAAEATVRGGSGLVSGYACDFAVGFSRQPLPNGRRFACTHTGVTGISATDASTCWGPGFVTLRPETDGFLRVKLLPTATFSSNSTAVGTGVGHNKIANGVKQQLSGIGSRGGGWMWVRGVA